MSTVSLEHRTEIGMLHLADGLLVSAAGELTEERVDELRQALLRPLPPECRDVLLDLGAVTGACDAALAVLIAAPQWARDHGARCLLSRSSEALDRLLAEVGVTDALPRLVRLPRQRRS